MLSSDFIRLNKTNCVSNYILIKMSIKKHLRSSIIRISTIILLFLFACADAQTHRFIYEYRFVPDSTKTDHIITENTRLEIFRAHSEFVSDLIALRDSAILSSANKGNNSGDTAPSGKFNSKIWKGKTKVYTTESIGIEKFKVINDRELRWEISSDIETIQGYHCQKATLTYGARKWIAWFTREITIPDGPHIFRQLPGLIVKVTDLRNHHSFLLIANYQTFNQISYFKEEPLRKTYEVNRQQFNKKWNAFRANPIGGTEQFMLMNPQISSRQSYDSQGNERNMDEVRMEERKQAQKRVNDFNNFIDLELYR